MADSPADSGTVFISYSHRDAAFLARLQQHLAPYVRSGAIPLWDDTQIKPGDDWKRGIEQALDAAHVALLLVSVSFLASEFVAKEELPKLLAAAEARGTRILSVILTPSIFQLSPLSRFKAINHPTRPLSGLSLHEQDLIWENVVETILDTLDASSLVHARAANDKPVTKLPALEPSATPQVGSTGSSTRASASVQLDLTDPPTGSRGVFISYSHRDVAFLEQFLDHLRPHVRAGTIPLWVDRQQIKPGDEWYQQIVQALDSARVAVLLVSVRFLASDFVADEELPKLLEKAEQRQVVILPVILETCGFEETRLKRYQSVNPPTKPLVSMKRDERNKVWQRVVRQIKDALATSTASSNPNDLTSSMTVNGEIARRLQFDQMDIQERQRCEQVLGNLTEREREVVRAFAKGLTPQEVAIQLSFSLATVNAHKTRILNRCRAAWNYPPDVPLTYHFLRETFGRYYIG